MFAKKGCSHETGLSVMLSLMFYFPGVIYAFAIILAKKKRKTEKATMMQPFGQRRTVSVDSDKGSSSDEMVVDS